MTTLRVLGRIRLSRETGEEGTSVERQRESVEQWSAMHGHTVVGWAVDTGVSGSVDPFEAPELGPWLHGAKLSEWDALVAYRLDRLSRRVIPLNRLFGFIQENGKTLASVSESLDLSTWIGRLVANVIAGVAEGELEAIRERNIGSQKKVRELGRWHGGQTPYGYTAVQHPDGWYLEPDPAESQVVREQILPRVLNRQSAYSIATALNDAAVPTRKGRPWNAAVIRMLIKGRPLLGQLEHRGRVVTDEDGLPLQRADPILSVDEHLRVVEALSSRAVRNSNRKSNPLGGVLFCFVCQSPMYLSIRAGRSYDYYRCARGKQCESLLIRSDEVDELVEDHLLQEIGELERRDRVFIPGSDHAASLASVRAAIETARRERDLGLYEGDDEGYFSRLERLTVRRKELELLPTSNPGFEWRGLGETYGQAWRRMKAVERRSLLVNSGIRLLISQTEGKQIKGSLQMPADVRSQVEQGNYP